MVKVPSLIALMLTENCYLPNGSGKSNKMFVYFREFFFIIGIWQLSDASISFRCYFGTCVLVFTSQSPDYTNGGYIVFVFHH